MTAAMRAAAQELPRLGFKGGEWAPGTRALPEEVAVALSYDGTTQAVMMASPADLEDFGIGFSLTEGFARDPAEIAELEVVEHPRGLEVRIWLAPEAAGRLAARRRAMTGPVGCGLCGIDSLEEALRPLPVLAPDRLRLGPGDVAAALRGLSSGQRLHDATRAVHAAGFFLPGRGVLAVREDVGRHNALDKLAGALVRAGQPAAVGAVVLTCRVSIDMVQKTVMAGAPVLIAVSAPTAEAVRMAEAAGLTLVALARGTDFEVFTHPSRIHQDQSADVV